eukprot:6203046-Pleurochrysis_carterae.AAC.1
MRYPCAVALVTCGARPRTTGSPRSCSYAVTRAARTSSPHRITTCAGKLSSMSAWKGTTHRFPLTGSVVRD